MTRWVLDTDHISLIQRGNPVVISKLATINPSEISITVITVVEQMYGRLDIVKRAKSKQELVTAYALLKETFNRLYQGNILDFDEAAFNIYDKLRAAKIRIGTQDLRIAAIALSVSAIVVTRNRKDFEKVPGLEIVDWSIP
jgi:tRNA(fMet)-specific endonuclease VapC